MYHRDFYSGEPVEVPPSFDQSTNMSTVIGGEPEYSYDPNTRYIQSGMSYQPASNGYYSGTPQPGFMNPPNRSPFAGSGNPALSGGAPSFPIYQQPQYQQPPPQDKIVHVPGFSPGGSIMLSPDAEEICDKMQMEMVAEQEEAIERRNKRFQGYFNNNYGNNYYGMPFMNNYADETVNTKYRQKINKMKQEAVERRRNFNKRLSHAVHNALGDNISEDQINTIYDGYDYTIPATQVQFDQKYDMLSGMIEVSNSGVYAEHSRKVSESYKQMVDPSNDTDMNTWLNNLGMVQTYYNLEEEYHSRRNVSQYYQGDSYRRILRRSIAQRDGSTTENIPMGSDFPVLNESADLLDDGTLSITVPDWIKNKQYDGIEKLVVTNELEQHFEENRARFVQSIMNNDENGGG